MITLRPMTLADIPLGMQLKEQAGWNQTSADWQMLLGAGTGLVATVEGRSVGTATVVPYGDAFSWVGMILVDRGVRRRGIGTALLRAAIALAREHGAARLDATPQGKPLYAGLGFREEYDLVRMMRPGADPLPVRPSEQCNLACSPVTDDAWSELSGTDLAVFGADRVSVLRALWRRAPAYAYAARRGDALVGYCFGRSGSIYDQIGPIVAEDPDTAWTLLCAALPRCGGRDVILDVPTSQRTWRARLARLGFERRRGFTRMCLECGHTFGLPDPQYAIAGPEIG